MNMSVPHRAQLESDFILFDVSHVFDSKSKASFDLE